MNNLIKKKQRLASLLNLNLYLGTFMFLFITLITNLLQLIIKSVKKIANSTLYCKKNIGNYR